MSKKTKRQASRTSYTPASTPSTAVKPGNGNLRSTGSEKEFNPDYTSQIKDLRRIGVLAGSFFVVLIVLSFFLH
jgi:hypothetical protein